MRALIVGEGPHELDGALPNLVLKLLNRECQFACEKVSNPKVHVHLRRGTAPGFTKRTLGWLRYAEREGFDALVLVIDQDGYPERQRQIEAAQEDLTFALRRALGVAVRCFDAWMLADEQALTKVLECAISRQKKPEAIQDPKSVCRALRDGSGRSMGLASMYAAVAETANVDILESRCPTGFVPFAAHVRRL